MNPNFPHTGPMLIEKAEPVVVVPEPEPIPEPEPKMSVDEQNTLAISNFGEKGFEAEQVEKGVVVYLPPEIYFNGSGAKIDLEARNKISQVAEELNKDYLLERRVEVIGHTDSTGVPENNLGLSKLRAESASGELVFSKVNASRIELTWLGDTAPRYPESNSDGSINYKNRARNRRVEFIILNP